MIHPKCLFSNLLNKMKKPSVKDLFAVWGVVLFVSAGIWIVAQSNANDEAPIMIDTNKYTATQHKKSDLRIRMVWCSVLDQ